MLYRLETPKMPQSPRHKDGRVVNPSSFMIDSRHIPIYPKEGILIG